jgi:RNA polymerase sigma-70 factor (ECF subfamily)
MDSAARREALVGRFDEWYQLLRADARRKAKNRAHEVDPSQIAADALMKAFLRLDQFRGTSENEFRGWLRKILSNDVAEQLRKAERLAQPLPSDGLPADGAEPAHALEMADEQALLTRALDQLPPEDREVILLYHGFKNDLSREMIAETYGISVEALRQRASRARTLLRELLTHGQ